LAHLKSYMGTIIEKLNLHSKYVGQCQKESICLYYFDNHIKHHKKLLLININLHPQQMGELKRVTESVYYLYDIMFH